MTAARSLLSRSLAALAFAAVTIGAASAEAKTKPTKVAVAKLSDEITTVDGAVLVPVDDLLATVGCGLRVDPKTQAYEAWPCKAIGPFHIDVDAIATYVKTNMSRPGEKQGFNPQPDPPRELSFDDKVVSRKIVVHDDRAYLDLREVAQLMGGVVKGRGAKARIVIADGSVRVIAVGKKAAAPSLPATSSTKTTK